MTPDSGAAAARCLVLVQSVDVVDCHLENLGFVQFLAAVLLAVGDGYFEGVEALVDAVSTLLLYGLVRVKVILREGGREAAFKATMTNQ